MSKKPQTLPRQIYVQKYAIGKEMFLVAVGSLKEVLNDKNNLNIVSNIGVYVLREELEAVQEMVTKLVKSYKE